MNHSKTTKECGKYADVRVWRCSSCDEFHVKAGGAVLSFSKEEFNAFVDETWNCFYSYDFHLPFKHARQEQKSTI